MLFTDQIGNKITLTHVPKRIISLIPSQSEYLWDLGLKKEQSVKVASTLQKQWSKFYLEVNPYFHSITNYMFLY